MSSKVGLWIDHRQAFIVYLSRDDVIATTDKMTEPQIIAKVKQHYSD
ncbi:MAG: hypothetical protein PHG14_01375 [Desulfobacter postgatei]|nr:hypothetical protein [Desulfobacter postgatei]MDD4272361.1 hypothetical protein [Desulfobacter postgatei]